MYKLCLLVTIVVTMFIFNSNATESTKVDNFRTDTLSRVLDVPDGGGIPSPIPGPPIWPKPTCCNIFQPWSCVVPHSLADIHSYANLVRQPEPIFVGGARYTLKQENFSPVFETRFVYVNGKRFEKTELIGYDTSFKIDGDNGQELIFDLIGKTSNKTELTASCGEFTAKDKGDKHIISQKQTTNGSCQQMDIKYRFSANTAICSIELNIMISEEI